jgi:hypothetical protein
MKVIVLAVDRRPVRDSRQPAKFNETNAMPQSPSSPAITSAAQQEGAATVIMNCLPVAGKR